MRVEREHAVVIVEARSDASGYARSSGDPRTEPTSPAGAVVDRLISNAIKALALLLVIGLLIVAVPVGLAALALAAVVFIAWRIRLRIARLRAPNGLFDERRNVRVRGPADPGPSA